jgi:hypothetical protein
LPGIHDLKAYAVKFYEMNTVNWMPGGDFGHYSDNALGEDIAGDTTR